MAAVTIVMSGDDSRLMAAHERLFAQQEKALSNYAKAVAKSKESQAQAEADFASRKKAVDAEKERLAIIEKGQKLIVGQRDAQEKFNAAVAEARELEKAGAISASDLAKRINILGKELREETGEAKKHADMLKRGQEITTASLGPMDKYRLKLKELADLHKAGAINTDTFTKAQQKAKAEATATATTSMDAIANWIGAYASLQGAIGLVTTDLENQQRIQKESLAFAKELGKSQQEAGKNLTGLTTVQKQQALQDVTAIQSATGFPDQAKLTDALGAAYSASGGNLGLAKESVATAAPLVLLSPEALQPLASSIQDIANATKSTPKEAAAFLLEAGAASRIEDPNLVAKNIAPALATAIATVPGQNPKEAASQATGAFASISNALVDKTGEITASAFTGFTAKMDQFFAKLPEERTKASEELTEVTTKRDRALLTAEHQKIDQAQIKAKIKTQGTAPAGSPVSLELAELKIKEQEAALNVRQAEEIIAESERRIGELKAQVDEFSKIKAPPATFSARLDAFRNAPGLRKEFLKTPFGEQKAQNAIAQLITKDSDIASKSDAFTRGVDFTTDTYENAVTEQNRGLTPAMATAIQSTKKEAEKQQRKNNPVNANKALVAETVGEILRDTRNNNIFALAQAPMDYLNESQIGYAANTPEAVRLGKEAFTKREDEIRFQSFTGKLSKSDLEKLQSLETGKARLDEIEKQAKQFEVKIDQSGFQDAAKVMADAARDMQAAANRMSQPPSIAPGARAMADTAR